MQIQELEQLTGLDRATIRYYEKQGLLRPARMENGYRDYSQEDVQDIQKIKLLRQLDLSLDTIKMLQQGRADCSKVLRHQADHLTRKSVDTERAAQICKEISDTDVSYQALDPLIYLDKMLQSQPMEQEPAPVEDSRIVREYHPVRRLVARWTDYYILRLLIHFVLIVVFRVRPYGDLLSNVIRYANPFLAVPLLAWMEHLCATTPGKWLMGIRLESYAGGKLGFRDALQREWNTLRYGYGFGIPFWRLWRMWRSYKDYSSGTMLQQDHAVDHIYAPWNLHRKSVFAFALAAIIALNCVVTLDLVRPKYRSNDLTIAEFAENYNYYAQVIDKDGVYMEPDGTWRIKEQAGTTVTVHIANIPERSNAPFEFELEGERVVGISYQNSWSDIMFFAPIGKQIYLACMTAVMSQKGMGIDDLFALSEILDVKSNSTSASFDYENVHIEWEILCYGCQYASKGRYVATGSQENSKMTLDFKITIH